MKCHFIKFGAFLFLMLPALASAGWQVAKPTTAATPSTPFFQTNQQPAYQPAAPAYTPVYKDSGSNYSTMGGTPTAVYAISVSGSLKENIERIMDRYHWKVVWKAPYDYNFDGRVTGNSLPNVMEKLLKPFPLQAVLYMSNRTMAVVPRKV